MNKLWHEQNKMPPQATLEERIQWHREHQAHCGCRPAPKSLLPSIERDKQGTPASRPTAERV